MSSLKWLLLGVLCMHSIQAADHGPDTWVMLPSTQTFEKKIQAADQYMPIIEEYELRDFSLQDLNTKTRFAQILGSQEIRLKDVAITTHNCVYRYLADTPTVDAYANYSGCSVDEAHANMTEMLSRWLLRQLFPEYYLIFMYEC